MARNTRSILQAIILAGFMIAGFVGGLYLSSYFILYVLGGTTEFVSAYGPWTAVIHLLLVPVGFSGVFGTLATLFAVKFVVKSFNKSAALQICALVSVGMLVFGLGLVSLSSGALAMIFAGFLSTLAIATCLHLTALEAQ